MAQEKITVVWAGNNQEFKFYCQETGQRPSRTLMYASSERVTRGLHNINLVKYGTYYRRRDYDTMKAIFEAIEIAQ